MHATVHAFKSSPVEFLTTVHVFKGCLVIFLSSFMIITAVSFLRFRIKKRESDYQRIINVLGINDDDAQFATRTVSEEFARRDYYLPVLFATITSAFGFISLLFGEELVKIDHDKPNLLLTGAIMVGKIGALDQLRWQSMLVLSMACLGAFVWSTQNIIRRLIAGDLAPSIYFSAGIRIIYAACLSLILSFLLESLPTREFSRHIMPVIAFLTGMLPEQALHYIRENVSIFSERKSAKAYEFPLQMIEGINMFHRIRLSEVGIDNAQNLAEANIIELLLKTPFNPLQLIDWVAQAKIFIYFKSDIEALRIAGIRTAFDLSQICDNQQYIDQLASTSGIANVKLNIVCQRLREDQSVTRLHDFENKLNFMISPERDSGIVVNARKKANV